MLDGLREPVRLAAGLSNDKYLDAAAQQRALDALSRFSERLRDLPREAVRAVGTNSLRVAKNASDFIPQAEHILGFPIEVIAGREEARLIYVGVAHGLPQSSERRLVIDIGGGSTEFIIGEGLNPIKTESLYMGCVSFSTRYFPDGKITKQNLKQAEMAARVELQAISSGYVGTWENAFGSSGTVKAIAEISELNGYSEGGITRESLEKLRAVMLKAGDVQQLGLAGIRSDRTQALAGGFAILYGAFCELGITHMNTALGALREGVLYDLWGRYHNKDMRDTTVQQFMSRYHVDIKQAFRVAELAKSLAKQLFGEGKYDNALQILDWATRLHEIGISVAHSGYHKHTAYILANADMPGFSKKEQARLSLLTLSQRGNLAKLQEQLKEREDIVLASSLRLAVLLYRNRSDIALPELEGKFGGNKLSISLNAEWLSQNQLTETALQEEVKQWKSLGLNMQILDE